MLGKVSRTMAGLGSTEVMLKPVLRILKFRLGVTTSSGGRERMGYYSAGMPGPWTWLKYPPLELFDSQDFLKYAGYFRGTAFVSWLGDSYHPADTTLSGYRLDYSPFKWIDIGFDHAVFMGGDGAIQPSPSQAIKYFIGFLGTAGQDTGWTNHLIGCDATFRIQRAMGAELYGKILFEDTRRERAYMMKSDVSYLGGVYLPKMNGLERLSIRLEGIYTGQYSYRHGQYIDGFALNNKFIGYDAGPDTYSGLLTSKYQFNRDEFVKIDFRYLRRSGDHYLGVNDSTGKNIGIVRDIDRPEEKHAIIKFGGQKKLTRHADLYVEAGYDREHNVDFVNGRSANDFSLQARMTFHSLSSLLPKHLNPNSKH